MKTTTTKYIGQVCDFDSSYEDDYGVHEIRVWDTGSEIRITGDCLEDEDRTKLHKNLSLTTLEATGDDDADLTEAWKIIEREVRAYFDGCEVEITD